MATIADVAAFVGVGAGTVSRVLNDRPKVSPETRAKVLAAIQTLEYRPSPLARGLSLGRCQTLGVVVPFFHHPSAVERLRGVAAGLRDSDYDLVLFNVESPVHRDEHMAALTRPDRAAGLLVMSLPLPPDDLERLRAANVPVVLVDAAGAGIPSVVTDDVAGGRIATRHLVDLGHRDIAFIGDTAENVFGFTSSAKRQLGYEQVLEEKGIPVRRNLRCHGPHERAVGRRFMEHLLAQRVPPTAVFAASDVLAIGVLEAVRAAGLRAPEDVSVIGFDDIEVAAYVGLTTVRQPLFDSGRIGARLLLDALAGIPLTDQPEELPLELVERATTAAPKRRRSRG